jgi:Ca2+/H+ antiporter, TMEM165/GDT1 family
VVVRQRPLARLGQGGQRGRRGYSGPVDLAVAPTTFVVIFPAELPDKSLFASLVLGTRFRPLPVFCGVAAAFAVHVLIAVTVGGVFALLPRRLVLFVVAALFAGGSAWLLLGREDADEAAEAPRPVADQRPLRVALASFGVVFLGEWGDITQITTANPTARYRDPLSVGIGGPARPLVGGGPGPHRRARPGPARPDPPGPPPDRRRPGRAGRRDPGRGRRLLTVRVARAATAGHADGAMVRFLLVWDRALDYGRVVTCGCPGTREPS